MYQKIIWKKIERDQIQNSDALGYTRPCPICGGLHSKTIFQLNNFQFYIDSKKFSKRFDITQQVCLDCFSIYMNPCYSEYGFELLFAEAGQSYGSLSEHTSEQISWLFEYDLLKENTKILDVGCFDGGFLAKLPPNISKVGVDIDQPAIQRGKQNFASHNIKFYHGDFETFNYDEEPPDTITMYHVLEHLPRPVKVLEKLREISKKDTKLVVEVPVLENGNTNDIHGFFSVQHTTHFSRASLRNCLLKAGWKIKSDFQTKDYNGYRVLAEPTTGDSSYEICNAEINDWTDIFDSLTSLHKSIYDVEQKIKSLDSFDKLVIWGAGAHTEYIYQLTSLFHGAKTQEYLIVDSDKLKQGKTWRGIDIHDPTILKSLDWKNLKLIVSSYGSQDTVEKAALRLGIPESSIFKIYDSIRSY